MNSKWFKRKSKRTTASVKIKTLIEQSKEKKKETINDFFGLGEIGQHIEEVVQQLKQANNITFVRAGRNFCTYTWKIVHVDEDREFVVAVSGELVKKFSYEDIVEVETTYDEVDLCLLEVGDLFALKDREEKLCNENINDATIFMYCGVNREKLVLEQQVATCIQVIASNIRDYDRNHAYFFDKNTKVWPVEEEK